jgi:hypothetical protein
MSPVNHRVTSSVAVSAPIHILRAGRLCAGCGKSDLYYLPPMRDMSYMVPLTDVS